MATTKILVEFVIEGDSDDAQTVLDGLLDNGVFQDPINDHDGDEGPLKVISALVTTVEVL